MNRPWVTPILLFLVTASGTATAKNQVAWVDDLATAAQIATARNQLIMIHFTADWCGPCQRLEKKVFSQTSFGFAVSQEFVPVKINVSQHPEIAAKFGVTAWPTDLLMTPDGRELHRMTSPQSIDTYVATLQQVSWRYKSSAGMQQFATAGLPQQNQQMPSSQIAGPLATQLAERFGGRQNLEAQQAQFMPLQAPPQGAPISSGASSQYAAPQLNTPRFSNPTTGQTALPAGNMPGDVASQTTPSGDMNGSLATRNTMLNDGANQSPIVTQGSSVQHQAASTGATRRSEPVAHMINNTFVSPASATAATASTPASHPSPNSSPATDAYAPSQWMQANSAVASSSMTSASNQRASDFFEGSTRAAGTVSQASGSLTTSRPPLKHSNASPQASESSIRLGLDGYCPVTLLEEDQWTVGDKRWGAKHRGSVYLFKSAAAQQMFLADPDRFSPMLAGYDPVLFCDQADYVTGRRAHGIRYQDLVILFSSEETLEAFSDNPEQYVSRVQQSLSSVPQPR